jgi:hypothetical protein
MSEQSSSNHIIGRFAGSQQVFTAADVDKLRAAIKAEMLSTIAAEVGKIRAEVADDLTAQSLEANRTFSKFHAKLAEKATVAQVNAVEVAATTVSETAAMLQEELKKTASSLIDAREVQGGQGECLGNIVAVMETASIVRCYALTNSRVLKTRCFSKARTFRHSVARMPKEVHLMHLQCFDGFESAYHASVENVRLPLIPPEIWASRIFLRTNARNLAVRRQLAPSLTRRSMARSGAGAVRRAPSGLWLARKGSL